MALVGRESQEFVGSSKQFYHALQEKGFERHKSVGNRGFKGLRLRTVEQKMFTDEMPTDELPLTLGPPSEWRGPVGLGRVGAFTPITAFTRACERVKVVRLPQLPQALRHITSFG